MGVDGKGSEISMSLIRLDCWYEIQQRVFHYLVEDELGRFVQCYRLHWKSLRLLGRTSTDNKGGEILFLQDWIVQSRPGN